MFFRPTRAGGDKRKPAKPRGKTAQPKQPARKTGSKTGNTPSRRGRRLDSAVPQLRPTAPPTSRPPAPRPRTAERGAPLSDSTRWLLDRMRRLKNLDDYAALKQPFIERYLRDPNHSPGSAERAFYQAVGVCIRRILQERSH